jgi:hypothetical protein
MRTIPASVSDVTRLARATLVLLVPSLSVASCAVPVGEGHHKNEAIRVEGALKHPCESAVGCDEPPPVAVPPSAAPDLVGSPVHRGTARAVTVSNRGTEDASPSITFVDIGWGCRQHLPTPSISAGSAIQIGVTLPGRCYRAGAPITIVVDGYEAVLESDETNNLTTAVLGVLGMPSRWAHATDPENNTGL